MIRKLWLLLFPEADREADLNMEIARMSTFVTKHYKPKDRVTFLQVVKENVLADLEREKQQHAEAVRERSAAIAEIKAGDKKPKTARTEDPNQIKAL